MIATAFGAQVAAVVTLAVFALSIAAPLWARHTDRRNHR